MDLLKIIPEIHTLTTGIYYKELKELLDYALEIPYINRKKYMIVCKELIYRECKRIGDYFNIRVIKSNTLPENVLAACINTDHFENLSLNINYLKE